MRRRPTLGLAPLALVGLVGLAGLVGGGPAAAETSVLLVSGLGGDPTYVDSFYQAATQLYDAAVQAGVPKERIWLLTEDPTRDPARVRARSSKEAVLSAVAEMASGSAAGDDLWVILIGHGSVRDGHSSINLPGPDLVDTDFGAALAGLDGRHLVFVNTASSSGGFIEALSGKDRVVVTATKSGAQRNETQFAGYFVAALGLPEADADRDGHISVLEAFQYAAREVERYYESLQLLRTEHAMLDDNGDGKGSLDPQVLGGEGGGDGLLAARLYLGAGGASQVPAGLEDLAAKRDVLQGQLDELRRQKGTLAEEVYEQELERLLLEIAQIDQQLRAGKASGGDGSPRDDGGV